MAPWRGLAICGLLLLATAWGVDGAQRRHLGVSPAAPRGVERVSVPSIFKNNANQVASKVTKALNYAALKFPRRDCLQGFKRYEVPFQISDKHYWAAVGFTGIWGYGLALVCFIFAFMVCSCKFCCYICGYTLPDKNPQRSNFIGDFFRVLLITFLIVFIMAGAAVFFWGTAKTGAQLSKTSKVLFNATDFVFATSNNIVDSLNAAASVISDPASATQIRSAADSVDSGTSGIESTVKKIKSKVPLAIQLVVIFLDIIGAFVLLFALIGLIATGIGSSTLGTIAFLGMGVLLVAVWLLGGIDFALSNVTNDVCQSMSDYVVSPASSSFSANLPCQTPAAATSTSESVISSIKTIVSQSNSAISSASGSLPLICDPYGAAPPYAPVACGGGTKLMSNFQTDYAAYKCVNDDAVACAAASTPLTKSAFDSLASALEAATIVQSTVPDLNDALTCTFINDAFLKTTARCVKLIDGLNIVWFGFAIMGSCMLPLQLFWLFI